MRIRLRRVFFGAKTFVIGSWQPHLRYSGNPRQQSQGAVTTSPPECASPQVPPARARRSPPPGKIPADKAGNGSAVRLTARFAGSPLRCWLTILKGGGYRRV